MADVLDVNVETGEQIERDYTTVEKKIFLANKEIADAVQAQELAEAEAKATAKAVLLNKLGITAEEAQLLLGGN